MASESSILSISCLYSEQGIQQNSDLLFCSNCMKRGEMEGRVGRRREGVRKGRRGKGGMKMEGRREDRRKREGRKDRTRKYCV